MAVFGAMIDVEIMAFHTPFMGVEESPFGIKEFGKDATRWLEGGSQQ